MSKLREIIEEKIKGLKESLSQYTVGLLQLSDMQTMALEEAAQLSILEEILKLEKETDECLGCTSLSCINLVDGLCCSCHEGDICEGCYNE